MTDTEARDASLWADWEFLGEDMTGTVLVSVEDCPSSEEAVAEALDACRLNGLDPTHDPLDATTRQRLVVCRDPDHEQGMCTTESPCNLLTDVWSVLLTFPEEPLP
jgi:hypothetical protein